MNKQRLMLGMECNDIPAHMQDSLLHYITEGRPVGGFLTAVMENDLLGAVERADEENRKAIVNYIMFLVNYAPAGCFGHKGATKEWRDYLKGTTK